MTTRIFHIRDKPNMPSQPEPLSCYFMAQEPDPPEPYFPPAEDFDNLTTHTSHRWKIPDPTFIGTDGQVKRITAAEAALNWQAENAVAQNRVLSQIAQQTQQMNRRVSSLSTIPDMIVDIKMRIKTLNEQMHYKDSILN